MTTYYNAANNAQTSLEGDITAAATSFYVKNGSVLPAVPFLITIDSEIMKVEAKSGNLLSSITRAQEGTTAVAHAGDSLVENRWTAGMYNALAAHPAETIPYIATTVRDVSITGAQDIALIAGRTPKIVNVYTFINDNVCASWGFVTTATSTSMSRQANNTMVNPTSPIYLEISAGNIASGDIVLNNGKITITWSKTGSPTGTAQIRVLANYHD